MNPNERHAHPTQTGVTDPCAAIIDVLAEIHAELWAHKQLHVNSPWLEEAHQSRLAGWHAGIDCALSSIKTRALAIEAHGLQPSQPTFSGFSTAGASTDLAQAS